MWTNKESFQNAQRFAINFFLISQELTCNFFAFFHFFYNHKNGKQEVLDIKKYSPLLKNITTLKILAKEKKCLFRE